MEEIGVFDAWKILASYNPAIWAGVISAIVTFVLEIILCKKKRIFEGGYKNKEKAIKAGHVIKAKQISCIYQDRTEGKNQNRIYTANYEYLVDGKKRKKQILSTSVEPPNIITLYYVENPRKVFSDYDIGKNPAQILIYIIPLIVAYVVMKLMGFDAG